MTPLPAEAERLRKIAEAAQAHLVARDALEGANVNNLKLDDPRFAAVNDTLADLRTALSNPEGSRS